MELIQQYSTIFHIILVILAVLTICCLIRAVKGPSIADRLVAVNMMGTIVMSVIAVLALLTDEDYLVDLPDLCDEQLSRRGGAHKGIYGSIY